MDTNLALELFDGPNLDTISHTLQCLSQFKTLSVVGCDNTDVVVA